MIEGASVVEALSFSLWNQQIPVQVNFYPGFFIYKQTNYPN